MDKRTHIDHYVWFDSLHPPGTPLPWNINLSNLCRRRPMNIAPPSRGGFYGISLFIAITRREFGPAPDPAIGLFASTCRLQTFRSSSEWLLNGISSSIASWASWMRPGLVSTLFQRNFTLMTIWCCKHCIGSFLHELVNCFQWSNIASCCIIDLFQSML